MSTPEASALDTYDEYRDADPAYDSLEAQLGIVRPDDTDHTDDVTEVTDLASTLRAPFADIQHELRNILARDDVPYDPAIAHRVFRLLFGGRLGHGEISMDSAALFQKCISVAHAIAGSRSSAKSVRRVVVDAEGKSSHATFSLQGEIESPWQPFELNNTGDIIRSAQADKQAPLVIMQPVLSNGSGGPDIFSTDFGDSVLEATHSAHGLVLVDESSSFATGLQGDANVLWSDSLSRAADMTFMDLQLVPDVHVGVANVHGTTAAALQGLPHKTPGLAKHIEALDRGMQHVNEYFASTIRDTRALYLAISNAFHREKAVKDVLSGGMRRAGRIVKMNFGSSRLAREFDYSTENGAVDLAPGGNDNQRIMAPLIGPHTQNDLDTAVFRVLNAVVQARKS
ncbi:hypothetical protein KBD59_05275 [Candidatus Gracilibacteria bacterium]|nr:hypothetical protein [Candidatus Gracilibacteria bacterium]